MLKIAMVGEVDHGKSTLIGRILYDTKSLPEEKLKEIELACKELGEEMDFAFVVDALEEERKEKKTIEASHIFFSYKGKEFAIIDAPGHKEFIKNMATGVSQADVAVLIIAADEGIKEQTKRHAALLKLLGIKSVIVAVNKMDLVNYSQDIFEKIKKKVKDLLETIGLHAIAFIPISAYNGDNVVVSSRNMKWYNGKTLIEELLNLELEKKDAEKTVFCVQGIYETNGGKKLVTGVLLSGKIKSGETLYSFPSGKNVKVNGIFYPDEISKISAVSSPGLELSEDISRGCVLSNKELQVKKEIICTIFALEERVEEGCEFLMRCFTQEAKCRVKRIIDALDIDTLEEKNTKEIKPCEIGKCIIELSDKMVFSSISEIPELARIVLVKNGKIIAGGVVV